MNAAKGESGALKRLAGLLGAVVLIFAASVAVVWPLWSLATTNRRLYTSLLALAALGAVVFFFGRLIRQRRGGRL